jgi:hypothetical protein
MFMMAVRLPITDVGVSERRGFYLGADIGSAVPNALKSTRTNNGIGTNCDQWLAADTLNDGTQDVMPLAESLKKSLFLTPVLLSYAEQDAFSQPNIRVRVWRDVPFETVKPC